jgi:hypothetical protein
VPLPLPLPLGLALALKGTDLEATLGYFSNICCKYGFANTGNGDSLDSIGGEECGGDSLAGSANAPVIAALRAAGLVVAAVLAAAVLTMPGIRARAEAIYLNCSKYYIQFAGASTLSPLES